jgi:phage terminase Nu1 subunit (DNA packaging protein)
MNLSALSAVELAELFDVSEKTIRNWMNSNGLPFTAAGRGRVVAWPDALKWFVEYRIAEAGSVGKFSKNQASTDKPVATESYEDALGRKTRAEADLKELQLARERGQVAAIADVEKVLSASTLATQTQILAVPSRLSTQMLGIEDQSRAVAILTAEMRQLLSNLATIDAIRESPVQVEDAGEDE